MLVSRIDLHKRSDAIELRYLNRLQPRVVDAAAQEAGRPEGGILPVGRPYGSFRVSPFSCRRQTRSVSTPADNMTSRNWLALLLTAVSIGLLIPGLTQPVLTIVASINMLGVQQELFRQTQSVLEATRTLHESGNDFVAGLILFFSITVPFLKALALLTILALRKPKSRYRLYQMVRSLSKWAMADVFAVGVFIAMLAARGTDNLDGIPGPGFYYFAAYCLVSNLAFQVLEVREPLMA